MLFRPPDLQFYSLDRIAFLLLLFVVMLGAFLQRRTLRLTSALTWPMLALIALAVSGALTQPFDPQTWSLLTGKFVAPYALFHLSFLVFNSPESLRRFETFSLIVLAYLSFTAIAFLVGATGFIFPPYILDESLGIHIDRARTVLAGRREWCDLEHARADRPRRVSARPSAGILGLCFAGEFAARHTRNHDAGSLDFVCRISRCPGIPNHESHRSARVSHPHHRRSNRNLGRLVIRGYANFPAGPSRGTRSC